MRSSRGFTFLELILTVLLMGVLSGVTGYFLKENSDSQRYEETRRKMEILRTGILGTLEVNQKGEREQLGFYGDYGSLPSSLSDLLEIGGLIPWTYSNTEAVGAGWRGPYVNGEWWGADGVLRDAWEGNFVWNPTGTPPTLLSYGADGISGGTDYGTDLIMAFPVSERRSTVEGFVRQGEGYATSVPISIRYPHNGSVTTASDTTDANGHWSFSDIPVSRFALRVTGAHPLGPRTYTAVAPRMVASLTAFDIGGAGSGHVDYDAGTLALTGTYRNYYRFSISSGHSVPKTVNKMTCWWDRPTSLDEGKLKEITWGTVTEIVGKTPGVADTVAQTLTIGALETNKPMVWHWTTDSGSENHNMTDATLVCRFDWNGGGHDMISIIP